MTDGPVCAPAKAAPTRQPPRRLLETALASSGAPLGASARSFMEPRFGHDFSRVRIHVERPAADAAGALNAQAFTVGDHIVFGDRRAAPESEAARPMLAHELAHVVQQRSGAVGGRPGPGGVRVSDPADRFEAAAEAAASAVMRQPSGAAPAIVARAAAGARGAGGPPTVQRFLAGEDGHGGIEEHAQEDAGLTEKEYNEGYYGNWLRDFSQLMEKDSPDDPDTLETIRVLATGEFGPAAVRHRSGPLSAERARR